MVLCTTSIPDQRHEQGDDQAAHPTRGLKRTTSLMKRGHVAGPHGSPRTLDDVFHPCHGFQLFPHNSGDQDGDFDLHSAPSPEDGGVQPVQPVGVHHFRAELVPQFFSGHELDAPHLRPGGNALAPVAPSPRGLKSFCEVGRHLHFLLGPLRPQARGPGRRADWPRAAATGRPPWKWWRPRSVARGATRGRVSCQMNLIMRRPDHPG